MFDLTLIMLDLTARLSTFERSSNGLCSSEESCRFFIANFASLIVVQPVKHYMFYLTPVFLDLMLRRSVCVRNACERSWSDEVSYYKFCEPYIVQGVKYSTGGFLVFVF
jgi:hypothetical protein